MAETSIVKTEICRTRNREEAINILLPNLLGVVYMRGSYNPGPLDYPGHANVWLGSKLFIAVKQITARCYSLTVYEHPESVWYGNQVFSAELHILSTIKCVEGRIRVCKWRRGQWEDIIARDVAPERTISDLATGEVSASGAGSLPTAER